MEVASLICLCSAVPLSITFARIAVCVYFSSPASVFYRPFLISGVERLSRFQCLKSLEKAVLLVRLGSASQWQWGGCFLAINQKYPCGKLINVPLLGSGEVGAWGSKLSISREPCLFLRQICVFDSTAECLHEERKMLKSLWCANSWVHIWYLHNT